MRQPAQKYPRRKHIRITLTTTKTGRTDRGPSGEYVDVSIKRNNVFTHPYEITAGCQKLFATEEELCNIIRLLQEGRKL